MFSWYLDHARPRLLVCSPAILTFVSPIATTPIGMEDCPRFRLSGYYLRQKVIRPHRRGHVLRFAECLRQMGSMPPRRVFTANQSARNGGTIDRRHRGV